eukprot:CAMPEP_0176168566 /NCGR_PEP_ID=MMETSP0120_2-20121206/86272_1 /TAXON_ID=160619 /ORGANISM="Kryptoperidinium foliaceum, Strain CCMP 1326" /LENGTH=48 /DNA_ID= /DNA_START= /DNA_END= /DNA_ORIENTATION=
MQHIPAVKNWFALTRSMYFVNWNSSGGPGQTNNNRSKLNTMERTKNPV